MNISLEPGKYIVAVSGGVDSMSLLHFLATSYLPPSDVQLVVAHFDHGIRSDSRQDRELVQKIAQQYNLPFEYEEGNLGVAVSEAAARKARYDFLQKTRERHNAKAIVTAHHADDLLETAILNLLRGTGRKGLSSLSNRPGMVRPLLGITKANILAYAQQHGVEWREDSTNVETRYARNYVRHRVLPRFSDEKKDQLLTILREASDINKDLDEELMDILGEQVASGELERAYITQLPHPVSREVVATWLRAQGVREFDRKTLERLVVATKTGRPGTIVDIYGLHQVRLDKHKLELTSKTKTL